MIVTIDTNLKMFIDQHYSIGQIDGINLLANSLHNHLNFIVTTAKAKFLLKGFKHNLSLSQFVFAEFCLEELCRLDFTYIIPSSRTKTKAFYVNYNNHYFYLRPYLDNCQSFTTPDNSCIMLIGNLLAQFHDGSAGLNLANITRQAQEYFFDKDLVFDYQHNWRNWFHLSNDLRQNWQDLSSDLGVSNKANSQLNQIIADSYGVIMRSVDFVINPMFIHGDFHQGNILMNNLKSDSKIKIIIDFEYSHISWPIYDIAYALLMLSTNWYFDPENKDQDFNHKIINLFLTSYVNYFTTLESPSALYNILAIKKKQDIINSLKIQLITFLKLVVIINLNWCLVQVKFNQSISQDNFITMCQFQNLMNLYSILNNQEIIPQAWL